MNYFLFYVQIVNFSTQHNRVLKLTKKRKVIFWNMTFSTSYYFKLAPGFCLSKNFLVSAATTPLRANNATKFGNAIKPLKISAIVQTAEIVM